MVIAAEKAAKSLLQLEFQQLTFIPLKGYRISYSKKGNRLPLKMISQIPRLLLAVYQEHQWIKKVVKRYSIDAIISDNRFGLYHAGIPSVYITHQLLIKTGHHSLEKIAQKIHFWFIRKYTNCWVPDFEGKDNIAGELSHPSRYPSNVRYLGALSRFEKKEQPRKKYDLLVLLSGPEPQRSVFEAILLPQLQAYHQSILLVRGLPGTDEKEGNVWLPGSGNPQLIVTNHLSAGELNDAIQQAELVVTRSGYTTVMDLVKLKKKAVLVPTPGQTEQEYLAWHLMKQDFFYTTLQEGFSLPDALAGTADFPFVVPSFDMEQYKKVVYEFVRSL